MADAIRMLVLDDEKAVRESLAAFFEDEGFAVEEAPSSEEALKVMRDNPIDGVIVDLRLPGVDGSGFIREAHAKWPYVVFVIYTGSPEYELDHDLVAIEQVSEKVFLKPVEDLKMLSDEVRRLLPTGPSAK